MRPAGPAVSRAVTVSPLRLLLHVFSLGLCLRMSAPSRISMPVHPHFGDLAVPRLAKHRAARIDPFAAAAPAVGAAELGRKPRPSRVDLSRLERHLRLVG